MNSILETTEFIKKAHAGQTDKVGDPYWNHPVAVALLLPPEASEAELHAALLHDVVEDTPTTIEDLRQMGYTEEVLTIVQLITRPKGPDRPTCMDWIRSIAASKNISAIRVKLADNQHNSLAERIERLPPEERSISDRYARARRILQQALKEACDKP
jgi:(p)ppGpp synthase/HD superfamily hydrolase